MPNYIRVKQLNKPELSGFLLETLNENLEDVVYVTGDQIINGQKTFNGNLSITGSNVANVTNGATLQLSGYRVITTNETGAIVGDNTLNYINVNSNFNIIESQNYKTILANASSQITGIILSGNPTGFNTSIIQIGAGQIRITGSGSNVIVNSYNNQYLTLGAYAQISLIHTGNNKYIMYGDIG